MLVVGGLEAGGPLGLGGHTYGTGAEIQQDRGSVCVSRLWNPQHKASRLRECPASQCPGKNDSLSLEEYTGVKHEAGLGSVTSQESPPMGSWTRTYGTSHIDCFQPKSCPEENISFRGQLCTFCFAWQEARSPVCGPILRIVQCLIPSLSAYALFSPSDFSILPTLPWASFLFCNWFLNISLLLQCSHPGEMSQVFCAKDSMTR